MSTTLLAILGLVIVGFGVWLAGAYNSLVQLANNIDKAWSNIDVLLQQRHDELTKLVDAARGYMKHERDLLESIARLREGYAAAPSTGEKVRIENELEQQVARVRLAFENYPDLKANQNVMHIQERVSGLESQIADRREHFNDSVNVYNITIGRFPDLLAAAPLGYARRELLRVPESVRKDVTVDLG
jgi:LemA protein